MNTLLKCTLIALLFAVSGLRPATAQDARELLKKMDEVLYAPGSQYSEMRMVLTDRNGHERVREAVVWQQGDDKRLLRFTAPAAEAGIAFLSLPDDVMYLYMPAFGRERRIASHVRNQSFAGTDFSYDDLEARAYASTFDATLREQSNACYRLTLTPLPEARTDYSRIDVKIDKEHHFPMVMEIYDRGGNKAKVATYTFAKEDGYWYPREITMNDLQRNHSTRMEITNIRFNTDIDEQIFTVRNLSRY